MSNTTSVRPTELGDAYRALGDILDGAPSILTAIVDPLVYGFVQLSSPAAVVKVAEDLGVPHRTYGDDSATWTSLAIEVGPLYFTVSAKHPPVKDLHRPVDVTPVLEEQADAA